ncbi:MAG: putative permease [Clostridia bacterium]|nr:putative permease [Clostridia bacterium]
MAIIVIIWNFFQNQILGMKWLNEGIGVLLAAAGIDVSTRIGGSLQFFIYDTIKILILLTTLIFLVSYIQSYFPSEKTKKIIGRFKGIRANIVGAVLGTLTPFCSCSSIPLFIGFTNAGLPIGVTFSFLISSPLVDLAAFLLLISIFGLKIAIAYVVVGIVLAVIGGTLIDKLGMEKYIENYIKTGSQVDIEAEKLTKKERLIFAKDQMIFTVKKVWVYVLIGVGIGAIIHNWIPTDVIQMILGENNPFSVLLATVVGIPMYADIFGTIPVAEALFLKGIGVGTVLAFMMSVTALSLPSIIMLRKAVQPKLLGVFVGIISVGIVLIGYVFNFLGYLFV